jgi:hypothetical protein
MHPVDRPRPPSLHSKLAKVLGILAVVAAGIALYEFINAKGAEISLAAAERTHQADLARLQEMIERVRAAERGQSQLQVQVREQGAAIQAVKIAAASPTNRPAANAAPPPGKAATEAAHQQSLVDGQAFIAAYGAQVKPMLMNIGRAQIERNFASLLRSGVLTPAQIEALETATAEKWIDNIALTPNSVHPDNPNLKDEELKAILGEDGFKSLEDFRRLQPLERVVNDISSMSVFRSFTPEQSNQLLKVIANANSAYQSGGRVNPQATDWNQVIAQSQSFLSESQLNAVKAEAQLPQIMGLIKDFYQAQPPKK